MSQVDSVHAAARTVPSAETEPIRADEPFDALLAFISRTSAVSNDDFQRACHLGASRKRHLRVVEPQSDQTRTDTLRDRHRNEIVTKDTRADGLREQADRDRRADEMGTSSADVRQQRLRDTNANEQLRWQETAAHADRAETHRADAAKAGSTSSDTGSDQQAGHYQNHGGENNSQGRTSGNGTVAVNVSPQDKESGAVQGGSAEQAARQNIFATRDAQAIQSRGSGATGGLKQVASTGRPAGAAEFQNLIVSAARQRGPVGKAVSGPAMTAKSSADQSINPKDAASFNELARIVRSNIGQRHSNLVLRLDPPELGSIRIDMRMHDQTLTLRIEAQTPAGQEALQARLTDLRGALEQHGIQLNRVDVELRAPAPPGNNQDANDPNSGSLPWNEGETNGSWDQPTPHDGYHSADSSHRFISSESATIEATDVGEIEQDDVTHSAETGVDVVV